ncbi:MAG: NAD(P)-dependent oxidoreductase [Candidatus Latescibacteria bacterium]|nr:NAD(P)-dependent oxidoreductase [Candidatus Latescibacterota bacterium]
MSEAKQVLITGAAGFVGGILRSHWGSRYSLRLADRRPVENLADHESFLETDISNYEQMLAACNGVDTVVHLAADPSPAAEFYASLLPLNVIGGYNGFQAAAEAGCRRIVFASSVNAVLGYGGETATSWDVPIYPQNVYGATKCWGEALARVYADQNDLSCICVRLGSPRFDMDAVQAADLDKPSMGISPRDTAQLFGRCVDVDDVDFAIVHGISRHRKAWMDVEDSCRILGYEPQDGTAMV